MSFSKERNLEKDQIQQLLTGKHLCSFELSIFDDFWGEII